MNRVNNIAAIVIALISCCQPALSSELKSTIRSAQEKIVKVYGAGGFRQMEAYQSGILISPSGHVLTARSYVLDTDDLLVTLDDGSKWQAELLGSDPVLDLAVLKLPLENEQLPCFEIDDPSAEKVFPSQRILALSNLYGIATGSESVSVLHGVITAIAPLDARRGSYRSNYRGDVYIVDASANNPGAAGGALVSWDGKLLGVLGKELRSRVTGTWLNYALPLPAIRESVAEMMQGRTSQTLAEEYLPESPLTLRELGIVLVPNVLQRTPSFVDSVRRDSPADKAGLRPNDLIVFLGSEPINSCKSLLEQLRRREREDALSISVLRDSDFYEFELALDSTDPTEQEQ